jgi:hypothetical protein
LNSFGPGVATSGAEAAPFQTGAGIEIRFWQNRPEVGTRSALDPAAIIEERDCLQLKL